MENLFMQVFESRDWVAAQMRQQVDSHAQSLARGFHLHGHRPPPWLLPPCAGGPQELNGKPIIPEFLFAGSQITTPATSRTVFLPAAVPSTSLRSVGVPNGYAGLETICDTLDAANQHEVPQQKQVSADQELAEASSEVNVFSVVKRSRSRQRRIEDRSREKDQGTKSGSSDVMQDRIQSSEHATVGSNRTTASLSSKPCADGANNAGTTTSLLDQENCVHASEDRSTKSFKRSKDGDLGNQGVQLDCSHNQIASSENNVSVPNDCPVRNSLEVQVTGSVCHALPETYLSVEPKKLQFDGVESVCMDPASEQTVQQPECALKSANFEVQVTASVCHVLPETYLSVEPKKLQFDGVKSVCTNPACEQTMQQPECSLKSANFDLAEAHSINEVQVTGSVCRALPETYLSVEVKKLQFDGVESVCMNPVSEQTMQQSECALESDNFDLAEAHSLNEDPPSTSCSQVPRFMGRLLLDGVEPEYLNPDSAPMKQLQESVLECSSLGTQSVKEDQSPTSSSKVPNPTSVSLVERDTLHILEDTERSIKLDGFSDRIITQSPESSEPQCSDSHVSHPPYSESLEPPTQLADPSSEAPASSQISPDGLVEVDGCEDLLHSLINDEDSQSSQFRSAACQEKLHTSLSPHKTQSSGTHSNGSPVVNASVSPENELSQEQHVLARTSLELNEVDVDTPLGHASPGTQNETLDVKPAYDSVNCHSGKLGDDQGKFSALTKACDISASNRMVESAAPEVKSSISARRTSGMHTTERNSMTSAENLHQDGTEDTSLLENAVEENTNLYTADKWKSFSQPCDQKRSVQDEVQVNGGLSSKRRRMRCRSDFDLSRTPCANSLSLNRQVGIAGDLLTTTNFSEKFQPSGHYFLRSSGSCKSMSLDSELGNAASNCKISVASDSYGNRNSSCGRRNTTSLLNVVLDNSPSASTSRSTVEGRVFDNSQEQMQNNLEVEFLSTTYNEVNCTQQEDTCLPGQDLNVTSANVADQGMASPITISNPENYFGTELFPVLPSYALDQHGEQASAPNALFHQKLCDGSNVKLGRKYKSYDPKGHLLSGAAISRQLDDESFECDDSMPEFESFDVPVEFDSPTVGKRPFEALYDSNAASGVWETLSGKPRSYSFSDDLQQYSASDSRSIMDSFGCGLELDSFFISDAVASCSSDANSRQEINETPLTPSVEKYSLQKLSSRSGSGSEHMGSIPELECFRIDEDNSIPEEDEYQDTLPGYVDVNCSEPASGRKALQDITGSCQNIGNSPSLATRCMDRGSIDLSAESFSSEPNHHSNIRNDHPTSVKREGRHPTSVKREGRHPTSVKREGRHPTSVKREGKVSRSLQGRFGTAEKLNSRNGRHRSEANADRQSKPSNIVANMTSFIPLVKQKSQPTTACAKKDVKVKALKAAEAAKRLEEKKQKEQEIRKAAAKVERERLKREKELKQKLEEEQKKKRDEEEKKKRDEEEQKKKREVDVATKKRQREEVEKKETMKKRKCIDEARKQQKQPIDRRRGTKDEKDARQKASDNMEPKKNFVEVGKNQVKPEGTSEPALRYKGNTSKDEKGVAVDERSASFGSDAKESIPNCLEESYKMSPFKDSDDEDDDDLEDEEESRRRLKFVPSWARKENLDKILLSNIALDHREIFAQKSSFDISEVFSAYIPKRALR